MRRIFYFFTKSFAGHNTNNQITLWPGDQVTRMHNIITIELGIIFFFF